MFWKRKKKEFTCSQCGEVHHEWPSLGYKAPLHYDELTEEEKESRATLEDDFCVIKNESETYRFIRVILEQKIKNHPKLQLEYGLWVSLSKDSFDDYKENFRSGKKTCYFGWLCSWIDGYESTLSIPTDVHASDDGLRPIIIPHESFDHLFVKDFYQGISKEEAEKRIHLALENYR